MKIVKVKFIGSPRFYEYKTKLDLILGATYNIEADNTTRYTTPVVVIDYADKSFYDGALRELTKADCIKTPEMRKDPISKVYFNEEKRTTVVVWTDGTKTKLKCADNDMFDKEKAVCVAFVKRYFDNRGAFNDMLRKWVENERSSEN